MKDKNLTLKKTCTLGALNRQISSKSKGVTMRAIFSNPAG